jgi:hypothetical protein
LIEDCTTQLVGDRYVLGSFVLEKEYKMLRKEERKERQNSGRTGPLIYINPPLLI